MLINIKIKRLVFLLFPLICVSAVADTFHYWVEFVDKDGSGYSLERPGEFLSSKALERRERQKIAVDETDLPVSEIYLEALKGAGAMVIGCSKWMNGVSISVTDTSAIMPAIRALSFVKEVELTQHLIVSSAPQHRSRKLDLEVVTAKDSAMVQKKMLHVDELNELGFRGDGMCVAVIDAGFKNVDVIDGYDSLRIEGRLLGTRNFVDEGVNVFTQDVHGEAVLSTMAANVPGKMVGIAPKADYWLLVSEDVATESIYETDNWVRALEFADSVGVDVVNSSLGYNDFDDKSSSWTYADMDGRSTRISLAATLAARKGMLVVISAGNEGNNDWRYITAPADADSVITVGAVDRAGLHSAFSSYGPTVDGRLKPTFCALGTDASLLWSDGSVYESNGTSFAAPILAAAATCLWQACPQLTNMELIELMRRYASLVNTPNNSMGYGIPNVARAYYQYTGIESVKMDDGMSVYPNPFDDRLMLKTSGNVMYEVFDAMGREVYNGEGAEALNTASWGRGVYLLRERSNDGVRVYKLIKR